MSLKTAIESGYALLSCFSKSRCQIFVDLYSYVGALSDTRFRAGGEDKSVLGFSRPRSADKATSLLPGAEQGEH